MLSKRLGIFVAALFFLVATAHAKTPVVAPLTGPVTLNAWVYDQDFLWPNSPSGSGKLRYSYMLPPGYDPVNVTYPIVMTGGGDRQSMEGPNGSYPTPGAQFVHNTLAANLSTLAFQTAHPSIIVSVECDQSTGSSAGPNGNCGGYADSPMSGWNEQAINGLLQWASGNWSVTLCQRYGVGESLSAIGYLAEAVDNNAETPIGSGLWTAVIGFSDQMARSTPNSAWFSRMVNVPWLSVCSPGDNPCNADLPFWDYIAGTSMAGGIHAGSYPTEAMYIAGGMAAVRAGTSNFYLVTNPNQTSYAEFGGLVADGFHGDAMFAWLFQQTSRPTPLPPCTPSPDDTVILAPSSSAITDADCTLWTITSGGQVAKNGVTIAHTGNVIELAYVKGVPWQLNTFKNWYSLNPPGGPTTVSPLPIPPPPPVENITEGTIGQQIAGAPFTVSGGISGLSAAPTLQYWDNAGTPTAVPPASVTATSYSFLHPGLPVGSDTVSVWDSANHAATAQSNTFAVVAAPPPPPGTPSPDKTVVLATSGATITDAAGNLWTISNGQVLENGRAPAFSANVAQIAYVNGKVFQGNQANQWYVWSGTAWMGGPNPFTSTCAYNPSAGQITCTNITP